MAKSLANSVLAIALAALLSVTAETTRAGVLATATIELENLLFRHTGGAILDVSTDFAFLNYSNTGATAVSFTGTANQNFAGTNTPLDLGLICNGSGCAGSGLTNNGFQHLAAVTGSFAAADQLESGFPVTGLGLPVGATVSSGAWGQIQAGSAVGNANSNNGLTASLEFVTNFSGTVDIEADFDYFWKVLLSAGELAGSFAHSSGVVTFNLVDLTNGVPVFNFVPAGLNWDFSLNGPAPIDLMLTDSGVGSFSFTTPMLFAGNRYQLTAREVTLAEVTRVPEPGTLALLGLALLGLALTRRALS